MGDGGYWGNSWLVFGDYVAKWFGYRSGWKYWSIRVGVVAGGAVIGWFAGSAIIRVATRYLSSNPQMLLKISSRFSPNILVKLLQILGYNPIGRMNKSFLLVLLILYLIKEKQ